MKIVSKKVSKFSLRNLHVKLFLSFTLILIIPALAIGLLSYETAKNEMQQQILDSVNDNVAKLNRAINDTINPKLIDIEVLANNITSNQYQVLSSPEIQEPLKFYQQTHPEVDIVYTGNEDGVYIMEPAELGVPDGYDARERDWYKQAMERKGESVISEPYVAASTGEMVITISKANDDGTGVVGIDINLNKLQEVAQTTQIGKEGYGFILDQNKKYLAHPTADLGSEAEAAVYGNLYKEASGQLNNKVSGETVVLDYITNDLTGWKIGGTIYTKEIKQASAPILYTSWLVAAIAVVIGIIAVIFIIKSITKPIRQLGESAVKVSQGDLTQYVEIQTNDVIGKLGQAFNEMIDGLRILTQKVERTAESVASASEQLSANTEETNAATEQVSSSIQEVAKNAELQTNTVDKVSQTYNEVAIGVTNIAERSSKVTDLSRHAVLEADEGGQAVSKTVTQMQSIHTSVSESHETIQSLHESSKAVNEILSVISGIADQTNLLALNAAIEAARAGEHGKGFAVVAEEVRHLAGQTQTSAKEIHAIITKIQDDTENTVGIMERITEDVEDGVEITREAIEKFNGILHTTNEISPQMEEVSAAVEQMSAAIQEVTAQSDEIVQVAQSNAATSEEVAASTEEQLASMEEISASVQSLSSMAEDLKSAIANFKY
ncbi:methyl-accepting chemotaxis protein [Oceanobacillus chungangensis]|uniref:methyl-accepting chemotaxis protein n=1 Tax=Oceanobacillus chungangensis TaxID=1229152 RepID=UPI001FE2684E|nr:methyl-accepting chemotaxis protein [Oceanobacillus chungangensis]